MTDGGGFWMKQRGRSASLRAYAAAFLVYLLAAGVLMSPLAADPTRLIVLPLNGLAVFALMRRLVPSPPPRGEGGIRFTAWHRREAAETRRGDPPGHPSSSVCPQVRLDEGAAFLAGLIFMLSPAVLRPFAAGDAAAHFQWTPVLYALALLRLSAPSASRVGIAGAVILFAASGLSDPRQIVYAVAPISAVVLIGWAWRRDWAALRRGIAALILGGLLVTVALRLIGAPGAAPHAPGQIIHDSLSLISPLLPPPKHMLTAVVNESLGITSPREVVISAYIGLIGGLLALIGVVWVRAARLWLALGAFAFLLAMGPLLKVGDHPLTLVTDGVTSAISLPLAWIAALPGIDLTPERFALPMGLALAVMGGYGAAAFLRAVGGARRLSRWVLIAALAAGITLDMGTSTPLPMTRLGAPLDEDDAFAALEIPPGSAPSTFTAVLPASGAFTESVVIPVYTPATTGALLTAALAADGREVIVRIDDQPEPAARWTISGGAEAAVFIGLEAGFHLITLTLDPPCVASLDPTLVCRPVMLERLTLEKG
ncbi:MAG: hypothetical protein L6Q98_12115 [Anaerolineae bacterium]|nr:hypothetical protein [Anaerolineae bacterium]NUQ06317.1 hypothetical protein [Anaerolineae bacterium]